MRVLVCGGRNYRDRQQLFSVLDALRPIPTVVISGCARGADSLGIEWAEAYGIPVECYPADWNQHGRSAGIIRNRQMLTEGQPDLVVAFPGGVGTANMVRISREAGLPIKEVRDAAD